MRGVAGEKEAPELHRLDDKAAHRGDSLLQNRALVEFPAVDRCESLFEFVPDFPIRPVINLLFGSALQIEPGNARRAHTLQCKAALVVCINKFLCGWTRLGENTQPREWVCTVIHSQCVGGNSRSAYSVEAVASRDEIAVKLGHRSVFAKLNRWRRAVEIVHADIVGLENDLP